MLQINTITHRISCLGEKNENGRTQTMLYFVKNGALKLIIRGEIMDSPEDFASMQRINEHMKKVRQDFIQKNAASELSAEKCIITC